jgi:Glycosyltransferase
MAARRDETSGGGELTVGYWGFIRPDKGVDLLLEAFAQIQRVRPARLVLAGDPGPEAEYIASLTRKAESLGIASAIRTTGKLPTEQLSAELRAFDVCVLPFREGLRQNRGTYAGAVAHGLYVVTTSAQSSGFDQETNTALVPPNDREALASAILEAPAHPQQRSSTTPDEAWGEIAELHLAAYGRALDDRR